jgi:hypothetical protein
MDPICEYCAALWLLENELSSDKSAASFVDFHKGRDPDLTLGFRIGVLDVCKEKADDQHFPPDLKRRAGIVSAALETWIPEKKTKARGNHRIAVPGS